SHEGEQAEVAPFAGMDAQSARRVVHAVYPAVGGNGPGTIVKRCAATAYLVGGLFHLFRGHHLGERTPASKTPPAGADLWCHQAVAGIAALVTQWQLLSWLPLFLPVI